VSGPFIALSSAIAPHPWGLRAGVVPSLEGELIRANATRGFKKFRQTLTPVPETKEDLRRSLGGPLLS